MVVTLLVIIDRRVISMVLFLFSVAVLAALRPGRRRRIVGLAAAAAHRTALAMSAGPDADGLADGCR
jgi:hypothetical protein